MNGLNWQTWHMRFAAGLNQKADPRTLEMPELAVCKDAMFDKLGGLQTRYPFALTSNSIFGGGTLSDWRVVAENGDELLLFTKDTLYSWNAQLSKWVAKGTHLAVKIDETPRFVTPGDQVDGDRAELSGTIVYAWTELLGSSSKGYVAAIDKTTGNVLMAPTPLAGSAARLRLTALSTKILLTFYDGTNGLYAYALDPAAPATALAGSSTTVTNTNYGTYYDITRVAGADQAVFAARRNPTTSYIVGTVTAGLVVATSTKARTCDGPIAVSCSPTGTQVQVIRTVDGGGSVTTDIKGDLITISTLADVYTAQAVGTADRGASSMKQVAAAHRSTQDSGQYRCYAFWTTTEIGDASDWKSKSNWVDTGNTLGTEATFLRRLGIGSRAFSYNGRVYFWGVFAGTSSVGYRSAGTQLQNSYFLYRDDGFLVAKATYQRAGGFAYSVGCLPNVQLTSGSTVFSWCGTERRLVPVGQAGYGYSDRGPRDITFTFDSNEARRTARLGRTLYITGGEILQYDGQQLVEVGFHVFPWTFTASGTTGNLLDGTYAVKPTLRWDNSVGDLDRSTTATAAEETISGGPAGISIGNLVPLYITHKTNITTEIWRTLKDPTDDAPFYRVTSSDPAVTSNPNRYLTNDPTASYEPTFEDALVDDDAGDLETNPENGSVLISISPPAASIILATETRLFLAGVAGDPDRIWYSKQRSDGQIAAFNAALVANVPPEGGAIKALAIHNETLTVFRERAIYAMPGDGFDNGMGGSNYGPARVVSHDVGAVSQESIAITERGIVFHSSKGKWLLNTGWQIEYIGGPVSDYDSEAPLAVQTVAAKHEIRWLTSSRMLVLNTLAGQWSEWTVGDGLHACMWKGQHVYLASSGPKLEQTTYAGVDYGMDIETAWIKLADLQGYGKVDHFHILGEYRSAHRLQIKCARDYWKDGDGTFFQTKVWTVSPTTVGARETVKHAPSTKQLEAIKIRITALGPGTDAAPTGEALRLTGLSFELGFERGLNRMLPSAQKQ
jgi:hypothetical protein